MRGRTWAMLVALAWAPQGCSKCGTSPGTTSPSAASEAKVALGLSSSALANDLAFDAELKPIRVGAPSMEGFQSTWPGTTAEDLRRFGAQTADLVAGKQWQLAAIDRYEMLFVVRGAETDSYVPGTETSAPKRVGGVGAFVEQVKRFGAKGVSPGVLVELFATCAEATVFVELPLPKHAASTPVASPRHLVFYASVGRTDPVVHRVVVEFESGSAYSTPFVEPAPP